LTGATDGAWIGSLEGTFVVTTSSIVVGLWLGLRYGWLDAIREGTFDGQLDEGTDGAMLVAPEACDETDGEIVGDLDLLNPKLQSVALSPSFTAKQMVRLVCGLIVLLGTAWTRASVPNAESVGTAVVASNVIVGTSFSPSRGMTPPNTPPVPRAR
jgi:hypothetical protein